MACPEVAGGETASRCRTYYISDQGQQIRGGPSTCVVAELNVLVK
jgi:hypothetical protein